MPSSLLVCEQSMVASTLLLVVLAASSAFADPGQPTATGTPGQYQVVGNSLVSAQQVCYSHL